jgi:uncharacterized membrane protein
MLVLQILLLLFLPAAIQRVRLRLKAKDWLSPVVLCYVSGILLGNAPGLHFDAELTEGVLAATVILAIPMLLVGTNLPAWWRQAPSVILSFGLAVLGVVLASVLCFLLFPGEPDAEQPVSAMVSAMLAGGLTGSALNLNAVGIGIDAPEAIIGLVNVADILNGAVYLIFLTSVAQSVLLRFLPAYRRSNPVGQAQSPATASEPSAKDHNSLEANVPSPKGLLPLVRQYGRSLLYATGVAGLAAGTSLVLLGEVAEAAIILALTVLSIGASFVPRLRRMEGPFELGNYLLLIFCVAIGMEADVQEILSASPEVFGYSAVLMVLALLFHYGLAWLFRIDADTVLITSTAAIYGPPFIGQVALALRNREIVFSGIITALVGYAVGNFLGLGVYWILSHWLG